MRLILPGSIRSKKNSKIATVIGGKNKPRRAIILPSKAYTKWEKEVKKEAWYQLRLIKGSTIDPVFKTEKLHVKVTAYYRGPRPDLSGCLESVGDCLEGIIWANDRQIESWDGSRLVHDKDNPRTVVDIEVMD